MPDGIARAAAWHTPPPKGSLRGPRPQQMDHAAVRPPSECKCRQCSLDARGGHAQPLCQLAHVGHAAEQLGGAACLQHHAVCRHGVGAAAGTREGAGTEQRCCWGPHTLSPPASDRHSLPGAPCPPRSSATPPLCHTAHSLKHSLCYGHGHEIISALNCTQAHRGTQTATTRRAHRRQRRPRSARRQSGTRPAGGR